MLIIIHIIIGKDLSSTSTFKMALRQRRIIKSTLIFYFSPNHYKITEFVKKFYPFGNIKAQISQAGIEMKSHHELPKSRARNYPEISVTASPAIFAPPSSALASWNIDELGWCVNFRISVAPVEPCDYGIFSDGIFCAGSIISGVVVLFMGTLWIDCIHCNCPYFLPKRCYVFMENNIIPCPLSWPLRWFLDEMIIFTEIMNKYINNCVTMNIIINVYINV